MVASWLTQPAIKPSLAVGIGPQLGTDPRKIGAMGADCLWEVSVLMAGQATAHLNNFFTPLLVNRCGDTVIGLDKFKWLTGIYEIGDHRTNFDRLVAL